MATFNAHFHEDGDFNATFQTTDNMQSDFGEVIRVSTSDYNELSNKPTINTVVVIGDKRGEDYNLQDKLTAGEGITLEGSVISADPEFASYLEVMNYLNS